MRVREQVAEGWQRRIESIKHKVQIADRMLAVEKDIYSRSFWADYRRTMMHRFYSLVKNHDYIAN